MDQRLIDSLAEQMRYERSALLQAVSETEEDIKAITGESKREESSQEVRLSTLLARLDEREQESIREIDDALARILAGTYGKCANCGRPIQVQRLRALPTTLFCLGCAKKLEAQAPEGRGDEAPESGRLPPDLEQLDDQELSSHLKDLVREDGHVDMEELKISARNGVVYLEGAVPSEEEHEVILNIMTDVAGIEEIMDHLEVERLGWERDDRSKKQSAQDAQPSTKPRKEPLGGTENVVLSKEEGVTYEPPTSPPPLHRKD